MGLLPTVSLRSRATRGTKNRRFAALKAPRVGGNTSGGYTTGRPSPARPALRTLAPTFPSAEGRGVARPVVSTNTVG